MPGFIRCSFKSQEKAFKITQGFVYRLKKEDSGRSAEKVIEGKIVGLSECDKKKVL